MISNRIFVAAVAMLAWIAAGAQKRLTMQECIDMAVKNNYGIRAAEGEVEKSQLMQGAAWDLDKTSLSLKQDPTSGGSPDNSLTLSQSFDFPTVYALRRRSLKAETAVAKSRAGLSRKQLSAEVANAYGQMVFVIEKKRILAEQDTIIGKYLHLATVRYMAGEARQLEKLTASRMRSENRMELEKTDAEYRALKQKMRTRTKILLPPTNSRNRLPMKRPAVLILRAPPRESITVKPLTWATARCQRQKAAIFRISVWVSARKWSLRAGILTMLIAAVSAKAISWVSKWEWDCPCFSAQPAPR